jgi:peptidoglycan/LPS O-acetylase OafA/YrhL
LSNGTSPVAISKSYFPQLDSIRGLSFIAIFLFHAARISQKTFFLADFIRYIFSNLPLAIDVFFVLSSFLLTWLGLMEYKKRGNFSFKNYFRRRALRIWPLYFFILFLGFIVIPAFAAYFHVKVTLPNAWYYIFFIANFYTIDHVFFLRILWTISVEEQFYLFWGGSLKFFNKNLKAVTSTLILISVSFSVGAILLNASTYFNTLTYLFDFACGGSAALFVFNKNKAIQWLQNLTTFQRNLFYLYLVVHFILFYFLNHFSAGITNQFIALINRYIFVIYIAVFIARQVANNSQSTFLAKNRFLNFTGKISYGLYCYHGITITTVNLLLLKFHIENGLLVLIYFAINYAIATISYFYLETPFLKLKQKWRRV